VSKLNATSRDLGHQHHGQRILLRNSVSEYNQAGARAIAGLPSLWANSLIFEQLNLEAAVAS
jgi:hypothetical protein